MVRRLLYFIMWVVTSSVLSGCSVVLALAGHPDPDFDVVRLGATEQEIEEEFGSARYRLPTAEGYMEARYDYVIGDEPAVGRALIHLLLDFATFGLWEIAGTAIELDYGEICHVTVYYDEHQRVAAVNTPPRFWRREEGTAVVDPERVSPDP